MSTQAGTLEGKRVGKYMLKRLLGRGGTGDVYLGVTSSGKQAAVKLLDHVFSKSPDMVARFQREADAIRQLSHPNIVQVVDVGSARGRHYIAMEVLRAGAFRRLMNKGKPQDVLVALAEVARALAYAHAKGIIHRDIKPENVLLTRSGKAKVADFGLARVNDATTLTNDGAMLGTAYYMSPEQAQGTRASNASDVYSLGVVIYETTTGALPFSSDTPYGFIYQHANETPRRPRMRRGYSPALGRLAMACMVKDANRRPTMIEVAQKLTAEQHWKPWLTMKLKLASMGLLLLGLTGTVVAYPEMLDPLCGDWFGAAPFRSVRAAAQGAHDSISGDEPNEKPKRGTKGKRRRR